MQSNTVACGTLAARTALLVAGPTMTHGTRLLSVRGSASIHTLTPTDGPWLFGYMSSDLSPSELEEYLELGGPLSKSDIVGQERASRGRNIRTVGIIVPTGDGSQASLYMNNHGLGGLSCPEDSGGWTRWIYNLGNAMSTGATLLVADQMFVEWTD